MAPGLVWLLWDAPGQLCLPPTAPARLRSSWLQFQLPLLPLAGRGRKAGASSASPLLILVLPGPLHLIEQKHKNRARALLWHPGHEIPLWECTGAAASPSREKAGPCGHCWSCSWALGSGRIQHSNTRALLSPNCRGNHPFPAAPGPQPAQLGEPGTFLVSGGRPGHPRPLPWARRGRPSTYLMASDPRNPQTPPTPTGTSHIPRPPWLIPQPSSPGRRP